MFCFSSSSLGEGTSRALDLGLQLHSPFPHREQDALGIPRKHSIPRTSCAVEAVNDFINVPFPFYKGAGFGCSSRLHENSPEDSAWCTMVRVADTQDGRELQFWEFFTKLGQVVDLQGAGFRVRKCQIFFLHPLSMGTCFYL